MNETPSTSANHFDLKGAQREAKLTAKIENLKYWRFGAYVFAMLFLATLSKLLIVMEQNQYLDSALNSRIETYRINSSINCTNLISVYEIFWGREADEVKIKNAELRRKNNELKYKNCLLRGGSFCGQ